MARARATVLADIFEEHFEELEFLWGQRQTALRSPIYTRRELGQLEERIEAHLQGLLVAGDKLASLLTPRLAGEEPNQAFAAAYPLLRAGNEAVVADAFYSASGPALLGLADALCQAGVTSTLLPRLIATGDPPLRAAYAVRVLAFHHPAELTAARVVPLLRSEEPAVRIAAWQAVSLGGLTGAVESCAVGWRDADAAVRHEARLAAAWLGVGQVLEHCRSVAAEAGPDRFDAGLLLAMIGSDRDAEILRAAARASELGPHRFELLGYFGHPAIVEDVLSALRSKDVRVAVEAGKAFTQITGFDCQSSTRVTLPPEDGHEPDEFEKEFLDDAFLPDPTAAESFWAKQRKRFAAGTRWCRGVDLSAGAAVEDLPRLDRASYRAEMLRARLSGRWQGRLAQLEAFPTP